MPEANVLLSESLLNPAVLDVVTTQMVDPERCRALRSGIRGGRDLARSGAAGNAPIGKRGQHRADLGVRVGVIEMVMRVPAVEEHRLFDQALAHHLRDE